MKMFVFLVVLGMCSISATAQLKTTARCPDFEVDVLDGKVNGIRPDVVPDRIKLLLPCFTTGTAIGADTAKCGTVVSYKDRDVIFFTDRDYVQIGPAFKGKFTVPIMGADRKSLFNLLGSVKLKDANWEAYQTSYGCLIVYFDKANKVNLIQFSTLGTEAINLCE